MKHKLYRDKVMSRVKGKDLVGVYIKYDHIDIDDHKQVNREVLLAEMNPKKADAIIKLWNTESIICKFCKKINKFIKDNEGDLYCSKCEMYSDDQPLKNNQQHDNSI